MRLTSSQRFSALALTFAVTFVLTGCGGNPFTPPPDGGGGGLPPDTPLNDSPQNTMTRFQRSYEYQVQPEYVKLLTSDFRYTFSALSDPLLAARYNNLGWNKDDETQSTDHLFNGFTSTASPPVYYGGATNITMALTGVNYDFVDPAHQDSTAFYKWVYVANITMAIDVPDNGGTTYNISAAHQFFLVRGDVAHLDPGQEARADRWYIRRWDDLSPSLAGAMRIASVNNPPANTTTLHPTTWGALKGSYLK